MCLSVIVKLQEGGGLDPLGAVQPWVGVRVVG